MGLRPPSARSRFVRIGAIAAVGAAVMSLVWSLSASAGCSSGQDPAQDGLAGRPAAITVSAASDLALALDDIVPAFKEETGVGVRVNLGSSGQLAQQIAAGAPVDVYFSADRGYVQELIDQGLVDPSDAALYGLGRVTIWTRSDSPFHPATLSDLAAPGVDRIAIANPDHAPYGRAAREALQSVGLWDALRPRIVLAENVLQALQFADSGNADVALVARSLSVEGEGSWVLVPGDAHEPIEQTAAVISSSGAAEWARRFVQFVNGPEGRPIMRAHGFLLPGESDGTD